MLFTKPTAFLAFGLPLVPVVGLAANPEDLKPVLAKLSSDSPGERIVAIRELLRLKASGDVIRPHFEKLLADPEPDVRSEVVWAAFELMGEKGADFYEKFFEDPDHSVRDNAIKAACRLWDKQRPKSLCKAGYDHPDFAVRIEILNTLREYSPRDADAAGLFRRALSDASRAVQRAGVFGTQAARDASAVPALITLASTADDAVAVPAAEEALATIGTPEAIKGMIGLLPRPPQGKTKPTDATRAAAARALSRIKAKEALTALKAQIDDPSLIVKLGVMDALTEIGDTSVAPAMRVQLTHKEERVRKTALRALRRFKDAGSAEIVGKVMKEDALATVRASAVTCYADILGPKAVPLLAELKADTDASVRLEAAGALAGLGKPGLPALLTFLKDPDPSVLTMTIDGIGNHGGKEHVAALADLQQSPAWKSKGVRVAIARAIGTLAAAEGIALLEKLSTDNEPMVRQYVATSLGRVGGSRAKTALDGLAKDQVQHVRQAAQKALESLAKKSLKSPGSSSAVAQGRGN
jgi:HEAT repeat protein